MRRGLGTVGWSPPVRREVGSLSRRVAVTKAEQTDIERAARDVAGLSDGFSELFSPSSRVSVKPDLCKAAPSGSGSARGTRVFEAITKMVPEHNPAPVAIAGDDGLPLSMQVLFTFPC